ncbi:MAG: hypothetical protein DCC49_12985 [Acidobacteria bacterium]|nr:MAG: hypothetical protein DCC49_12985 [Acidobacteriota bacterium]
MGAATWSLVVAAIAWARFASHLKLPLTAIAVSGIVVGYHLFTAAAGLVYPEKVRRRLTRWPGYTYWRNRGSTHHRSLTTAARRVTIGGALLFATVALFPPWLSPTTRNGSFIAPLIPPPRRISRSSFDLAVNAAFRIDIARWVSALLVVAIATGAGLFLAKFLWQDREASRRCDGAPTDRRVHEAVKIVALYLITISVGAIALRFREDPGIVLEYGWIGSAATVTLVAACLATRGIGSFFRGPPHPGSDLLQRPVPASRDSPGTLPPNSEPRG